jgi:hypothetical protein
MQQLFPNVIFLFTEAMVKILPKVSVQKKKATFYGTLPRHVLFHGKCIVLVPLNASFKNGYQIPVQECIRVREYKRFYRPIHHIEDQNIRDQTESRPIRVPSPRMHIKTLEYNIRDQTRVNPHHIHAKSIPSYHPSPSTFDKIQTNPL